MKTLSTPLKSRVETFFQLDDSVRKSTLEKCYHDYNMTWKEMADIAGTYPNRMRREAKRLGVESRSRSDAQKLALAKGTHPHPTKGKERKEEVKIKISESVAADWDGLSEDEKEERRLDAVRRWENRSPEERKSMRENADKALRYAAKHGSKLEKFMLTELTRAGYRIEFHKEHWVVREKLQIDLFVPALNVAIEVDGPSHHRDIWGEDILRQSQKRDSEKTGLLLQRGLCIIRVKQTRPISKKYKRDILEAVLTALEKIKVKFPPRGERHIVLGD